MAQITPEIVAQHGLSEEEYARVLHALGREPNLVELGIFSVSKRLQPTLPGVEEAAVSSVTGTDVPADPPSAIRLDAASRVAHDPDAPLCMQCGVRMQRSGSCHACPQCGTTSGCS